MALSAGNPAPEFKLPDRDGDIHRLSDYQGQTVVLYFYPKDDTPGCIKEACSFRDACQGGTSGEALPEDYAGLENPYAEDNTAAASGAVIYAECCARCHGDDARGKGGAKDLVPSADNNDADYLFYWISTGGDSITMPSFSSTLSEDQIWQVITYITELD